MKTQKGLSNFCQEIVKGWQIFDKAKLQAKMEREQQMKWSLILKLVTYSSTIKIIQQ